MTSIAYVANSNLLELIGLQSAIDNAYINDAVVTVTIHSGSVTGDPVAGPTWPLTMVYVAASTGNYQVGLTHTLPFLNKKNYVAEIDANGGSDPELWGHWEFVFTPITRTGT